MPPLSSVSRRLAVSLFSDDAARRSGQFETWAEVGAWLLALTEAGGKPTDAVARKARELTAGVTSDRERIRAIARYVQSVQYVSIQTGLGRGGGYQPRPPELVMTRNYGDCKDKASLMRAMLAAVGIQAHLVAIFSGDREYVREQWPSPQQFNHMVVAIAAAGEPDGSSVFQHPVLGRLVIFDPTDEYTPVGEVPFAEQGSLALIVAPDGGLHRVPLAPPAAHGVTRRVEGQPDESGGMTAQISERLRGHRASAGRALRHSLVEGRYRERLERHLVTLVPGGRVMKFETGSSTDGEFSTKMAINAPEFLQQVGNLMLLKPPFLPPVEIAGVNVRTRHYPILLEPAHIEETLRLQFPAGMKVDELPAPVALDTPFGRYSLAYTAETGTIVATRAVDIPTQTVAPAAHAALQAFLGKIRAADLSPVVLVKR